MGIRGKFVIVIVVIALAVGFSSYFILESAHSGLIEQEAVHIAEIVSTQVVSDRAEYASNVVGKLKADGTGAARHAEEKPGYVELPAQFVRNVSKRVEAVAGQLFGYSLLSQWNLNEDQGLKDDFDHWAWIQLAAQDEEFRKNGEPSRQGYEWKPVYRFEDVSGEPVLRYMRADPASAGGCVSCHNAYEEKPEVIAMRERAGVDPGKKWELHQLMGAIRVEVPVKEVALAAAGGRDKMLGGLGAVFLIGFSVLFGLIYQTIIRPVESSVKEVEGFSRTVDSVVGCSKDLVLTADKQRVTCGQTVAELDAGEGNQDSEVARITQSLQQLADAADDNAMKAEESAVYCSDLDESFTNLKGRLQEILGKAGR